MPPPVPWYADLTPAAATVSCGGQVHAVVWRDGALHLPDHGDLESERALAALAGERPRCLELLTAWERHLRDPDVLLRGPVAHRPSSRESAIVVQPAGHRRLTARQRRIQQAYAGTPRGALLVPPPILRAPGEADPLELLLGVPGALPHRFVASAAATLDALSTDPSIWWMLRRALDDRVRPALERWAPELGDVVVELTAHERSLTVEADGSVVLRLPLAWIHEVWARELEVLEAHFVLGVRPRGDGILDLVCVDRDLEVIERTHSDRGWAE